jgi:hypothetical protein
VQHSIINCLYCPTLLGKVLRVGGPSANCCAAVTFVRASEGQAAGGYLPLDAKLHTAGGIGFTTNQHCLMRELNTFMKLGL